MKLTPYDSFIRKKGKVAKRVSGVMRAESNPETEPPTLRATASRS